MRCPECFRPAPDCDEPGCNRPSDGKMHGCLCFMRNRAGCGTCGGSGWVDIIEPMKQLSEGASQLVRPRIPGSASDDWTAAKILFLRRYDLDQSARIDVKVEELPGGCSWLVRFSAMGKADERKCPSPTEAVQAMRRDYARFLVQRARSDLAALGLAGEDFTPRDQEVVEAEPLDATPPEGALARRA